MRHEIRCQYTKALKITEHQNHREIPFKTIEKKKPSKYIYLFLDP